MCGCLFFTDPLLVCVALVRSDASLGAERGLLRGPLAAVLGGEAMLVELAAIRSSRGAEAQQLHADTTPRWDGRDARMLTVFLPLQNVSAGMGE